MEIPAIRLLAQEDKNVRVAMDATPVFRCEFAQEFVLPLSCGLVIPVQLGLLPEQHSEELCSIRGDFY